MVGESSRSTSSNTSSPVTTVEIVAISTQSAAVTGVSQLGVASSEILKSPAVAATKNFNKHWNVISSPLQRLSSKISHT